MIDWTPSDAPVTEAVLDYIDCVVRLALTKQPEQMPSEYPPHWHPPFDDEANLLRVELRKRLAALTKKDNDR